MTLFVQRVRRPILAASIASAVVAILAGCATARSVPQLESARAAVAAAHADEHVTGPAAIDLAAADAALASGTRTLAEGGPLATVEHQAYLADRYASAAREHGSLLASQRAVDDLGQRRAAVLLAAREDEARRATAESAAQAVAAADARNAADESARAADSANVRVADLERQLDELQAKQTERGAVVTLGDVLFATGRSELQEGARRSLERLGAFLVANPERNIRIEGFTDSIGGEAYNLRLSERRADAVARVLRQDGVSAEQIATRGYGMAYPVAGNEDATGRQQNRRVEVVISRDARRVAERE